MILCLYVCMCVLPQFAPAGSSWKFTCQHGEEECLGNMIHACAKHHLQDIKLEMKFITCLLSSSDPPNIAGAKVNIEQEGLVFTQSHQGLSRDLLLLFINFFSFFSTFSPQGVENRIYVFQIKVALFSLHYYHYQHHHCHPYF